MKFNIQVSEGKRRLRLITSILVAIATYVYLYINEWSLDVENIFLHFPLISALFYVISFSLLTSVYWVLEGFEKEKDTPDILLFDICMSGADTLTNKISKFSELPVGNNNFLSKMSADLDSTILLESITLSFSLVCYSMLKIDKDFFSTYLSNQFTESIMHKLIKIDSGLYDEQLNSEKAKSRNKQALEKAIEAAEHMSRAPQNQSLKILEAVATLYCSKVFKNEIKQIQEIIKISRSLIKTNDQAVKKIA